MMEHILNRSKIYRGSKYKSKILAASKSPINKELLKQVESYIDEDKVVEKSNPYIDSLNNEDTDNAVNSKAPETQTNEDSTEKPPSKMKHASHAPASFTPSLKIPNDTDQIESEDLEKEDEAKEAEAKEDEANSSTVVSSTFVTVETVSQAVKEIPGVLNLRADTKGVTYAAIKSSSGNELWVYYDSDTDINSCLEQINLALLESGYYYLEFNRIVRDSNAVVFTINWISNYFQPVVSKD